MSKRINSRNKGKRGERAFRDVLREAGYLKARRGQQYSGEQGNPDVICPELPEIHWEVKCCESGNIYNWLEQAEGDTWQHPQHGRMLKIPIVVHKRNGRKWVAILPIEGLGLLEIIRRSDLPRVSMPEIFDKPIGSYLNLDALGIPYNGKGKISIPVKSNGLS